MSIYGSRSKKKSEGWFLESKKGMKLLVEKKRAAFIKYKKEPTPASRG